MNTKSALRLSNGNFILCWSITPVSTKRKLSESPSSIADDENNDGTTNHLETHFNLEHRTSPYFLQYYKGQLTLKTADPSKPQIVTAVHEETMKEMARDGELWGPVSWHSYSPYRIQNASFVIFLDFQTKTMGEITLLSHLGRLLDDQKMTDVQFAVQGQRIGGHVAVLAAGSPILAAMFENQFKENTSRSVDISDVEPHVFKYLLRYLYTGSAPELDCDGLAEELLVTADKYQVEPLKLFCEEHLSQELTLDNVVSMLIFAHLHSASTLYEKACNFVSFNAVNIWELSEWRQLNGSHPDVFFDVSQRVVKFLDNFRDIFNIR